jgi:ASC-1-like (ASCH) protein
MKRVSVAVVSLVFLIGIRANAQMAVTAPILETLMSVTYADQLIYYAQSIAEMVQTGINTYNQFQNMLRMEQMALNNLKGVVNVKNLDDFMNWYNRQLYLERQAENKYNNLGVKIGGQDYRIAEIEDIPNAMKSAYVDYWDNDFSEAQRKEMWLNLGLSPSNYLYVQAWETREKEIAKVILTKPDVINEENMEATERHAEIANSLKEDKLKPEEQKMGEKDLLSLSLEIQMDTNRVMRQMAYDQAQANELDLVQKRAAAVPPNPPGLSETWGKDFFGPITGE